MEPILLISTDPVFSSGLSAILTRCGCSSTAYTQPPREGNCILWDAESVPFIPGRAKGYRTLAVCAFTVPAGLAQNASFLQRPFTEDEMLRALRLIADDRLRFDPERLRASIGTADLALTPLEYRLLRRLSDAAGRPLGRDTLLRDIFPDAATPGMLNVYIHYLRRKLAPFGAYSIHAVRGQGYQLIAPDAVSDKEKPHVAPDHR